MSRNPYLAASRPASSFTRSSRTSGRRGTGGLLGRSRSSAALGNLSSQFGSTVAYNSSSYVPSTTWQRSSSSTRLNRLESPGDQSSPTTKSNDYDSPQRNSSSRYDTNKSSLNRSTSSHNLECNVREFNKDHLDNSTVQFCVSFDSV